MAVCVRFAGTLSAHDLAEGTIDEELLFAYIDLLYASLRNRE